MLPFTILENSLVDLQVYRVHGRKKFTFQGSDRALSMYYRFIEFGQNQLKRSNFFRFWIFWELSRNCPTKANFDLSNWNFVRKCTNTKGYSILNFARIGREIQIFDEFEFIYFILFLLWYQIIKIRCVRQAKPSNVLPQRTKFVKSVRKQYGKPDSHSVVSIVYNNAGFDYSKKMTLHSEKAWNYTWKEL